MKAVGRALVILTFVVVGAVPMPAATVVELSRKVLGASIREAGQSAWTQSWS